MVKRLRNVVGWFGASATTMALALGMMAATPQKSEAKIPWWGVGGGIGGIGIGIYVGVETAIALAEIVSDPTNNNAPCPTAVQEGINLGCSGDGTGICPTGQSCGTVSNNICSCK